ncbi:MAG: helix-turn-helix transcriptional regulator [Bacteriovoracaceae bacterium]|nr:helix-turn-helix transcriptional regulator [Bacteriovoracaceae bacterium]
MQSNQEGQKADSGRYGSVWLKYRYYQKLESGHHGPTLFKLIKIAQALKVKISDLIS